MNADASTDRFQVLCDKDEIRDVIMRFCRGLDRLDAELIRSCFHSDSYDDHGHFKGSGDAFATFIVKSLAERAHHTTHSVANLLVERDDESPDSARSEAYVLAYLRRCDDAGVEWLDIFAGRYVDHFERRKAGWRIVRRVVVHDWSTSIRLEDASFPLPTEGFEDLVYKNASDRT